jgi:glycosyltransferase involved in cell wall biosynthesis
MKRRLLILTEIISPYRIPLFNCLAQEPGIDLHVVFLAENDPRLRQWKVYREEIRFSHEILPSWRGRVRGFNVLVNGRVVQALQRASPQIVLCGGYNYFASWQALIWSRLRNVPFVLWSESNRYDARRGHAAIEMLKAEFLGHCTGFVVPGHAAEEYLRAHKIRKDRIFFAPNAIDNDLFRDLSLDARRNSAIRRRELDLPDRYVLFVGRVVREKGVFELVKAYGALEEDVRRSLGLVIVGDGPARVELQEEASRVRGGTIKFAGFVQREQLPAHYALAEMFVLPTYTDTWGLVVNEAMACGLPVIVSRIAGCTADLIEEEWNGLLIEPRDVSSLKSAISRLAGRPDLCASMGARASEQIDRYSPKAWSVAIANAMKTIGMP